jgi:hypothetical protein
MFLMQRSSDVELESADFNGNTLRVFRRIGKPWRCKPAVERLSVDGAADSAFAGAQDVFVLAVPTLALGRTKPVAPQAKRRAAS